MYRTAHAACTSWGDSYSMQTCQTVLSVAQTVKTVQSTIHSYRSVPLLYGRVNTDHLNTGMSKHQSELMLMQPRHDQIQ